MVFRHKTGRQICIRSHEMSGDGRSPLVVVDGNKPKVQRVTGTMTEEMAGKMQKLERLLNELNIEVGEGEFKEPVQDRLMGTVVNLERRVAQLEHSVYFCWELKLNTLYLKHAVSWKDKWHEKVQEIKASKENVKLGHVKNFIFMGVVNALLEDKEVPDQQAKQLRETIIGLVGDPQGNIDVEKVNRLDVIVSHADVKKDDLLLLWRQKRALRQGIGGRV